MYSGNQSSFSDNLDSSPLRDGPHPEGKPSIRDPVINRGGEFAPGIQRERSPTRGIYVVGGGWPTMLAVERGEIRRSRGASYLDERNKTKPKSAK